MVGFNVKVSKQITGSKNMQEFINQFLSNSLIFHIDKPIRISDKLVSLIDNFYSELFINICHSGMSCVVHCF